MNRAVFLDRDGVINRKLENDYVKSWDEFQFLLGVIEAIKAISDIEAGKRVGCQGFLTADLKRAVELLQ